MVRRWALDPVFGGSNPSSRTKWVGWALVSPTGCKPAVKAVQVRLLPGPPTYIKSLSQRHIYREDDMADTTELGVSRTLRVGPRSGSRRLILVNGPGTTRGVADRARPLLAVR